MRDAQCHFLHNDHWLTSQLTVYLILQLRLLLDAGFLELKIVVQVEATNDEMV